MMSRFALSCRCRTTGRIPVQGWCIHQGKYDFHLHITIRYWSTCWFLLVSSFQDTHVPITLLIWIWFHFNPFHQCTIHCPWEWQSSRFLFQLWSIWNETIILIQFQNRTHNSILQMDNVQEFLDAGSILFSNQRNSEIRRNRRFEEDGQWRLQCRLPRWIRYDSTSQCMFQWTSVVSICCLWL